MVFHISIVNWNWGVDVCSVFLHYVICETCLVYQHCIDVLSIGVWGVDVCLVFVHSAICDTYLV